MGKAVKILVVEDDPFIAELIFSDIHQLYPHGNILLLEPADSFEDALKSLLDEKPDIVLLDIELGEDKKAGINLAHHINLTRPIPIIFLSGLDRKQGFDVAKFTAPHGYLSKPYKSQELGDLLELLLIRLNRENGYKIGKNEDNQNGIASLFVSTSFSELTALPVADLVLLEADGKVIRAYLSNQEKAIIFTSPGLKNFFKENRGKLGEDFFQLSRKHVIRLSKIQQIKDNQVRLPRFSADPSRKDFWLPIPVNGESKKELFALLGKKT